MANYVFKKSDAGIRKLLKSSECMSVMEQYAQKEAAGGDIRPFVGFDRAKCFVKQRKKK